jgi:excinuclease ABC subunit C
LSFELAEQRGVRQPANPAKFIQPLIFHSRTADLAKEIEACPAGPGIYALHMTGGPVHIAWTANLPRRLHRLLVSYHNWRPDSALATLRASIERVECWITSSRLEAWILLYSLTKQYYPVDYLKSLRLRMPWFIRLTQDAFPYLSVVNRLHDGTGWIGPFPTCEAAHRYENAVLALFQIRRCLEILDPHPDHPGCIYGEMNQCLRPCQCAVSVEGYSSEVQRVREFLDTNGKSSIATLSLARDRASEAMEFEVAAQIHKRIEKMLVAAALRDVAVNEIQSMNGIALTATRTHTEFRLWPMLGGWWQEPLLVDFSAERTAGRSVDQQIRELLAAVIAQPSRSGNRLEHLAIFTRWYYSSWRDGKWYPFRTLADLDYRSLVREISKRSAPRAETHAQAPLKAPLC